MKVIINRSGGPLKIPEIRKEIPWDGKQYILNDILTNKYRKYLEVVDVDKQKEIEDLQVKVRDLKVNLDNTMMENDKLQDFIGKLRDNTKIPCLDFLYSFHFNENMDEAVERLRCSIESIRHQNVRVCVCNTSKKSIKSKLRGLGKIAYFHNPLELNVYNKPKTINLGVKKLVKTDYFFLSDIDLYYHPDFVANMGVVLKLTGNVPYRIVFHNNNMGPGDYPESIEDCHNLFTNSKDTSRSMKGLAPGNGLIYRPSFEAIEGFDEMYVGYGPEDADFNYRIRKICEYIEIDLEGFNTYHLFHANQTRDSQEYANNRIRCDYMMKMDRKNNYNIIKSGQIEPPRKLKFVIDENIREVVI